VIYDNQTLANRRNALLSTGPKSAEGRARSAKNALAHGLYAVTIVPALGESPTALAELCTTVRQILQPEGILQEKLCDRIALLLVRFDRVMRFEVAVASRDANANLSAVPDPETVTGAGVDVCREPHPQEPPVFRLAHARARIAGWTPVREAICTVLSTLDTESDPNATIPARHARWVANEVGVALGLDREIVLEQWTSIVGALDHAVPGARFAGAVRELAGSAGREPDEVIETVREHFKLRAIEYDTVIAEKRAEADRLAAELRAARELAVAAAIYADEKAVDTVIRLEAHLTRQLGLMLDLLDRLRGDRSGADRAGFSGLLSELTGGSKSLVVGSNGFVS
jgi:hypothetical protein